MQINNINVLDSQEATLVLNHYLLLIEHYSRSFESVIKLFRT